jgi:hypothetical protein
VQRKVVGDMKIECTGGFGVRQPIGEDSLQWWRREVCGATKVGMEENK